MQHLEEECVGLSFHLAQGGRAPSPEGTPLRLSRALEARVADVEGPADVRHWLQVIGHGEEHEWIDLGTVRTAAHARLAARQSEAGKGSAVLAGLVGWAVGGCSSGRDAGAPSPGRSGLPPG